MSEKVNHCLSCGLCCVYYPTLAYNQGHPQEWAHVRDDEVKIVPRQLYKITKIPPKLESYRTMSNEHYINKFIKDEPDKNSKEHRRCVALEGVIGKEMKCSVYENRPKVCRDFIPGSDRCNTIRKWGGKEEIVNE